jgi:hypothetical protein
MLLSICGLYHALNGLILSASIFGHAIPRALREGPGFWIPFGAASLGRALGILGLGGRLFEIPDPRDNRSAEMYEEMGFDLGR